MKFYFAGSIRGGREKVATYIEINKILEKYGTILDKHVASLKVTELEKDNTDEEIYLRDIAWIKECDLLVAEVSVASLGVGYEIAFAEKLNKKVICIVDVTANISGMINGNKNLDLIKYKNNEELIIKLESKLKELI